MGGERKYSLLMSAMMWPSVIYIHADTQPIVLIASIFVLLL